MVLGRLNGRQSEDFFHYGGVAPPLAVRCVFSPSFDHVYLSLHIVIPLLADSDHTNITSALSESGRVHPLWVIGLRHEETPIHQLTGLVMIAHSNHFEHSP